MMFCHKFYLWSVFCSVSWVKVKGNARQYHVCDISVEILVYFKDTVMIWTISKVLCHLHCIVANLVLSKSRIFWGKNFHPKNKVE